MTKDFQLFEAMLKQIEKEIKYEPININELLCLAHETKDLTFFDIFKLYQTYDEIVEDSNIKDSVGSLLIDKTYEFKVEEDLINVEI